MKGEMEQAGAAAPACADEAESPQVRDARAALATARLYGWLEGNWASRKNAEKSPLIAAYREVCAAAGSPCIWVNRRARGLSAAHAYVSVSIEISPGGVPFSVMEQRAILVLLARYTVNRVLLTPREGAFEVRRGSEGQLAAELARLVRQWETTPRRESCFAGERT